ncbi:MAG: ATP-binding cassette domain-containing protein [Chloroflexi bacterium]|nr:ATP-binding cassette domain-containing protein [Chloroflexota bacterium]
MALISLREVTLSFGGPPLLDNINLQIERGERVCLLGRNGTGKSSLLRVVNGDLPPDRGAVWRAQDVRTAYMSQAVPFDLHGTVHDVIAQGLSADDAGDAWQREHQIAKVISQTGLTAMAESATLSAGLKRRVLLAQGLVRQPDLLLLDEPTNHLDIESIAWLEDFLRRYGGTMLFVTHDRMFLRRLATRIIELDRGQLSDWDCDYDTFLVRKQAALENEAVERALFDKKLAKEEVWIRQGIKARRTRNEGRVRELEQMRRARSERRERAGTVRMAAQDSERSGQLVVEAEDVSYAFGERPIIRGLTTTIMRGDKVGLIGPNGSGKTTLLRILLGELAPQSGTIRHGSRLNIAYYDQLRTQLDEDLSAYENIGQGRDHVVINGSPRHVISYLQEFLFEPERARLAVRVLSGGERNRLMLAWLFTRPANVLVLDEPTNDLDVETLELLEELLLDYEGTLLLVSHDRAFLNNVVTSVLALEGDGRVGEYAGGYDDWLRQRKAQSAPVEAVPARESRERPKLSAPRLTYKEQRAREAMRAELDALPQRIETLETEQHALAGALATADFYKQPAADIVRHNERVKALVDEIAAAYMRWEELEAALK